jgi:hypothetical protein
MSSRSTACRIAPAWASGTVRRSARSGADGPFEQSTELGDSRTGARQLPLESAEMGHNHAVASVRIGSRHDYLDVAHGRLQSTESADHLRGWDLLHGVVAVAGVRVDLGRYKQPDLVVVAQCLDAEMRSAREVADGHIRPHGGKYRLSPCWRLKPPGALDSPIWRLALCVPTAKRSD